MKSRPIIHTTIGGPMAMHDRGGFWGPYSTRPDHSSFYFTRLVIALMDAGALWSDLHKPPAGYPFQLLGRPCVIAHGRVMKYHRDGVDLLVAGQRLERLTQRLQLLARERDCFRVLAHVAAKGSHAER